MLHIRLGKIVRFANVQSGYIRKATRTFFPDTFDPSQHSSEENNQIAALFNEWFIFDFVPTQPKPSIIKQYYFLNPDRLEDLELSELEQIINTQLYSKFQIEKLIPDKGMDVIDIFTGKPYYIEDIKGSNNNRIGTISGRLAKVNNSYYLVGSDPLFFPITYTKRAIELNSKKSGLVGTITPKTLFEEFYLHKRVDTMHDSSIDVQAKRKELEKEYEIAAKKAQCNTPFNVFIDFVYNENYQKNLGDFYVHLTSKLHIPEKMIFDNVLLFQDLWNFFPHKILGDKCPHDLVNEFHK